jgi:hypothetical protein
MTGAEPAPPPGSWLARYPWLTDANSWRLDWRSNAIMPHQSGVWPIGNGRVFAHAGLALPFNRLQGITGPTYQTRGDRRVEGAFGDWWVDVARDGNPLVPTTHRIWRPRHSGVLVTQTRMPGVVLTTIDFAPPDTATLVRLIELWDEALADLTVVLRFPAGQPRGSHLVATYRPGQVGVLAVLDADATVRPGALLVRPKAGDGVGGLTAVLCTAETAESAETTGGREDGRTGEEELERTRGYWAAWMRGMTPRVGHLPHNAAPESQPLNRSTAQPLGTTDDLIESVALSLKMQQARAGGLGPMVHFKGTWARDHNGPVRALLALGARDEVAALLRYYHDAALVLGQLPNHAPLDLDVSVARPPKSWEEFPVPWAEVPSWFVLQHNWWLDAGGDPDLVRRHWPMLERCIQGQHVSPQGLLPFHGDETYLHGALFGVADRRPPPNDLVVHQWGDPGPPWSLEATAAYATACEAMAEGAGSAYQYRREGQRTRAALEKHFWLPDAGHYAPALHGRSTANRQPLTAPIAPINLSLLWMGYSRPDDPRARQDLDAVVRLIGWRGATPRCPYDVGMTCGYMLWDLVATGSPLADRAFDDVVRRASPAGEWAEIYGPDGTPDHGYDPDHPNRLRPWEGGINVEAMLRFLRATAR